MACHAGPGVCFKLLEVRRLMKLDAVKTQKKEKKCRILVVLVGGK